MCQCRIDPRPSPASEEERDSLTVSSAHACLHHLQLSKATVNGDGGSRMGRGCGQRSEVWNFALAQKWQDGSARGGLSPSMNRRPISKAKCPYTTAAIRTLVLRVLWLCGIVQICGLGLQHSSSILGSRSDRQISCSASSTYHHHKSLSRGHDRTSCYKKTITDRPCLLEIPKRVTSRVQLSNGAIWLDLNSWSSLRASTCIPSHLLQPTRRMSRTFHCPEPTSRMPRGQY